MTTTPYLSPLMRTVPPAHITPPDTYALDASVKTTDRGTPYLQQPGIALLARTSTNLNGLKGFLDGFAPELRFPAYLDDPTQLTHGAAIAKTAGQLCYLSFGPERSTNADAPRYFENIRESKHGSVLEHTAFTFLFYGVSRSFTHELVRHRLAGYSQVSQRYVGGKTLRFVERPEYVGDPELHALFCDRIDSTAREYERLTELLAKRQAPPEGETRAERTARIKATRQAARSCLTNETEAPIITTMNARAWRHFVEMRASKHAEPEIRRVGVSALRILQAAEPPLFGDYTFTPLPDGTCEAFTPYVKV